VKVQSEYPLKPESEAISLSESQVQKYVLSTYLDQSLVQLSTLLYFTTTLV